MADLYHRSSTGTWKVQTIGKKRVIDPTDIIGKRTIWEELQWIKSKNADGTWEHLWPKSRAAITNFIFRVGGSNPDPNALNIVRYRINANGNAEWASGNASGDNWFVIETWRKSGLTENFRVRATLLSGSPPNGTTFALDTWYSAELSPYWTSEGTVNAPHDTYIRVEIGHVDGVTSSITDTSDQIVYDSNGQPLLGAGESIEVLDSADIGLRAGLN